MRNGLSEEKLLFYVDFVSRTEFDTRYLETLLPLEFVFSRSVICTHDAAGNANHYPEFTVSVFSVASLRYEITKKLNLGKGIRVHEDSICLLNSSRGPLASLEDRILFCFMVHCAFISRGVWFCRSFPQYMLVHQVIAELGVNSETEVCYAQYKLDGSIYLWQLPHRVTLNLYDKTTEFLSLEVTFNGKTS
jgi:hypothetical protein